MQGRRAVATLFGAAAMGITALAIMPVVQRIHGEPQAEPVTVDVASAFCRVRITHQRTIVSASIIDASTAQPLYTRGIGEESIAPSLEADARYAVDAKTGDTAGIFFVNLNGSVPDSCDVNGRRYSVEP